MKIIVVDDEMNALHAFLNEIIQEQGVEYKFYRDDVVAVCKYISENAVDAAFLDINMPNVNGVELAERLIALSPDLKVVFITGLTFTEKDLPESVRARTAGFLYKPYSMENLLRILSLVRDKKRVIRAEMFDAFDCFVDGKKVNFSSFKSKELFALLLAYKGRTLTMGDAIAQLWPDGEADKSKILYRDAVWRLRKTLSDVGVNCVEWRRAALSVDRSLISCDYWDYLLTGEGDYTGEFCKLYDWSVDYLAQLDRVKKRS